MSVIFEGTTSGDEIGSLTELDTAAGELSHLWPQLLPGGKALLFTVIRGDVSEGFDIAAQSLETGERRILIEGGTTPRYTPTGHLIYSRGGTLMAVSFDPERLSLTSPPVSILDNVLTNLRTGAAQFDFSSNGTLFYVPGQWQEPQRNLVWVDREGRTEPMTSERHAYAFPDLSDDGGRLLVEIDSANPDVWLYEISRGSLTRLTTHRAYDMHPFWSPDNRVSFTSLRLNLPTMYWRPVDEPEPAELILPRHLEHYPLSSLSEPSTGEKAQFAGSWSPDGKHLLYVEDRLRDQNQTEILVWSADEEAKPFVKSSFEEIQPTFSPDGRWIAYVSDESGRYEVYVRSFPSGERAVQVSVGGGVQPVWALGEDELFYRNEDKMMVVSFSTTPSFELEAPVLLFERTFLQWPNYTRPHYDVTPDGQRFVMVQSEEEEPSARRIHVVLNWFEELKRLVPNE